MNCEDMIVLISGHLDGTNSVEEEHLLQEHLALCASCRDLLAAFQKTDELIKSQDEALPENFCARVMEQIKAETGRRKRNVHMWGTIGASAAAVVLILGAGALTLPKMEKSAPMEAQAEMEEAVEYSTARVLYDVADEEAAAEAEPMEQYTVTQEDAAAEEPMKAKSVTGASGELPQEVADRLGGVVVYFDHTVEELKEYSFETEEDGTVVYLLTDANEAAELGKAYGGVLFCPAELRSHGAYALVTIE